ncbi:MAG: acetate kinase [Coriobacteriales bacterium]|nr:acetate kinase [Coriobacteriales bacterium]
MNVLVVNAGSSSLKYQLITVETREILAKGACERIGLGESTFSNSMNGQKMELTLPIPNHRTAISLVLGILLKNETDGKPSNITIDAIGHRIVHGGSYFKDSCIVDDEVVRKIEEIAPLAPLHNYAAASVIESCREVLPSIPNIVSFDTSFHATIPEVAWRYALPRDLCEQLKLRKYGFHGINHRYVNMTVNELTGGKAHKIVSCHLGNGSSITSIKDGIAVDTTMGFTPLDGLVMGTRCGSIDPATVTYIIENTNLTAHEVDTIMNKKSGLLAVSGFTNDIRDLIESTEAGHPQAKLALDMFCYSAKKYLGAMWAVMGGIDTVVFTAGAGQNSPYIRTKTLEGMEHLGFVIDEEKNQERHDEPWSIAAPEATVNIFVIPAGEEFMIAYDVKRLLS